MAEGYEWAFDMNCAVTVCDKDCRIIFMNRMSRETFARHGDIIGHSLMDYHPEHAKAKIREMLANGTSNAYTITKGGKNKVIYQTPWRDKEGNVAGLVEISMIVPPDMPHYDRG